MKGFLFHRLPRRVANAAKQPSHIHLMTAFTVAKPELTQQKRCQVRPPHAPVISLSPRHGEPLKEKEKTTVFLLINTSNLLLPTRCQCTSVCANGELSSHDPTGYLQGVKSLPPPPTVKMSCLESIWMGFFSLPLTLPTLVKMF